MPVLASSRVDCFCHVLVAVTLFSTASMAIGEPPADSTEPPAKSAETDRDQLLDLYGTFAEVVAQVEANYAQPVDRQKLFDAAIDGMLRELDPYSSYLGPEKLTEYRRRFTKDASDAPRKPTVAGLARGDDGGWKLLLRESPRVAYVSAASFTQQTPNELARIVKQAVDEQATGLILELRGNAGGLLTAAVDTADLFLDAGPIVSTQGRSAEPRVWKATSGADFPKLPLVVLIDRYSASGAEVVAAALQDAKRATIVGERSWGKGSVQNVFEVADGRSAIKLTTASYHRPSGVNIHRFRGMTSEDVWGVTPLPKWRLAVSDAERTAVAEHRKELLEEKPTNDAEESAPPLVDRQRDLAVKALLERLNSTD